MNLGNAIASLGGGNVVYVEPSGTCAGNTPCYSNIQNAINAAESGDTVKISQDATAQAISVNASKA